MDKKGSLSLNSIAVILLWAIGLVILLVALALFINKSTSASEEIVCRNSVSLRAKTVLRADLFQMEDAIKIAKFTPLLCDPIPKGKLEGNREEVKTQIADLAATCWWMYLEGSVPNIYESDEVGQKTCGICYYFTVPGNLDTGLQSNYLHFDELTQESLNELKQKAQQQGKDQNLLNLEEKEYTLLNNGSHKIIRPKNLISPHEFYNYLLSTQYNPKILYGGGNQNYMGGVAEFHTALDVGTDDIKLRTIKTLTPTHIQDYSYLINQETQQIITEFGTKLYQQERSFLYVVVANKIDRMDRADARKLIESVGLNSNMNNKDAVLVLIDVSTGKIRIQIGSDLEYKIKEYQIISIMENHFDNIKSPQELNRALANTIKDLEGKIIRDTQNQGVDSVLLPQGTYYQYVSNELTTTPLIELIQSERTYAVTYVSTSDATTWFEGIKDKPASMIIIGIPVVVISVVAMVSSGGVAIPAVVGAIFSSSTIVASSVLTYMAFSTLDESFTDNLKALAGRHYTNQGNNFIAIMPASAIADVCGEVN